MGNLDGTSVPGRLLEAMDRFRERPAQSWQDNDGRWASISYGELARSISQIAAALTQRGVGPSDRVLLMAATAPRWVQTDLAIQSLGAVTVPAFPSLEAEQVAFLVRDSDAGLAIVDSAAHGAKIPEGCSVWNWDDPDWPEGPGATRDLTDWPQPTDPDALATLVYTSGTTAHSRGVMLTHRNLVSNMDGLDAALASSSGMAIGPEDRFLSFLPLSHIFERLVHLYFLSRGVSVYYSSPDRIATDVRAVHPTILLVVPRLLERVMDSVREQAGMGLKRRVFTMAEAVAIQAGEAVAAGRARPRAWPLWDRLVYRRIRTGLGGSLRYVVSGGAALSRDLATFFTGAGIMVCEGYGLTEAAPVVAMNRANGLRFGTVGHPLPNVEVKLADDGEILCRGPNIMAGYWKDPGATEAVLDQDGWLHTGDVGRYAPDGAIAIVDRKKDILVLSTGKKVVPTTIEQALCRSPYIAQAVVLGDGKKYVAALLGVDPEVVLGWAREHGIAGSWQEVAARPEWTALVNRELRRATRGFAPFEQPKRWALLPTLMTEESGELTPSLKVKRRVVTTRHADLVAVLFA